MALTNCIATDKRYILSLSNKVIYSPEGEQIADLYHIDISKLTEQELIELTILFQLAYDKGRQRETDKFRIRIQNFFNFEY